MDDPTAEIAGVVELGQWSTLPDGIEYWLESTKDVRKFRLRKRPKEPRVSKVRHRRHKGRYLTDGPGSGM